MAKITWLGEDEPGIAGPSFTTAFGGLKFPKGEAVEVTDEDMIARARKNPFFKVSDDDASEDAPVKRGPGRPPNVVEKAEVEHVAKPAAAAVRPHKPVA